MHCGATFLGVIIEVVRVVAYWCAYRASSGGLLSLGT